MLLVVLSMLTLFLLLGTAYLVVSTRSRETARAYNRLVMQSDAVRIPSTALLDAALLRVLRSDTTAAGAPWTPTQIKAPKAAVGGFESLLEDRYGRNQTLTGSAISISQLVSQNLPSPSPMLLQVTSGSLSHASGTSSPKDVELPGRVLTLVPDGGEPTSHRILKAAVSSGTYTLLLDNQPRSDAFRLPKGPCRLVINGREFDGQGITNEAWDAFDGQNGFLAQVAPHPSLVASSTVQKLSYLGNAPAALAADPKDVADNDNDGQNDGLFLNFGFPGVPTASGTIDLHASVLIVDLDSRLNVNAHGSVVTTGISGTSGIYPTTHGGWTSAIGSTFDSIPIGSGYGPPEVNPKWMFRVSGTKTDPSPVNQVQNPKEDNLLWIMTGVSGPTLSGTRPVANGSRFSSVTSVATPRTQSLEGRYGESVGSLVTSGSLNYVNPASLPGDALPGRAGHDDLLSQVADKLAPPVMQQGGSWAVPSTSNFGVPSLWWTGSANFPWATARTVYNSPPDLHGRMKSTTVAAVGQGVAPQLLFAKPEWGDRETTDDPYELLLGGNASRNGWMADPYTGGFRPVFDNVYSLAELDAVLRPYDADSQRLPLRLAATLGSLAEESRLRVTSDSWDTTAITGSAAANLQTWLRSASNLAPGTSATTGGIGGEVARGERFDLNRPLTSVKPATYKATDDYYVQRQAYFKDLYTLICALLHPSSSPGGKAAEYAQWAANVVEFRDADSTMTPYEYDSNPFDGWSVDGNVTTGTGTPPTEQDREVVWGAERPEALITETSAWEDETTGELFIVLHRPWNALAYSSGTSIPAEPIDDELEPYGNPSNQLDLGRKSGTAGGSTAPNTYPIWRLRIEGGGSTAIVRLDITSTTAAPPGQPNVFSASSVKDATSTPKMGVDSWLCIMGKNDLSSAISTGTTVVIDNNQPFKVPGTSGTAGSQPREATIYLERLADPRQLVTTTTSSIAWTQPSSAEGVPMYRVVDQAPIQVVNRKKVLNPVTLKMEVPASGKASKISRNASTLWKELPTLNDPPAANPTFVAADTISGPPIGPLKASSPDKPRWFPWPNRPFVSSAELFLVPGNDSKNMLLKYTAATTPADNVLIASGSQAILLLDAVHAPTRFAGIHRTVTGNSAAALEQAGIYQQTTPVHQLSSWREPGRVNLNTVMSDDVWAAVVAGSLATSGSVPDPLPLKDRITADFLNKPATSMGDLLALKASGTTFAPDTHPDLLASGSLNPTHSLYTVNRLANSATIRSNVFAIWITLRESIAGDPDSVRYHRAFYIVDRSIPVAHEPGKDHNVWDAVVLRRIIE